MAKAKPTVIIVRNERVATNLGPLKDVIVINAGGGQVVIPPDAGIPNIQPSRHATWPDARELQPIYADNAKDINDQGP